MVTVVRVTPAEAAALYASSTSRLNEHDSGKEKKSDAGRGINNENEGGKKCALPSEDLISGRETKKRKRADEFVIDLTGIAPQQPIQKIKGRIKEGASKYVGVSKSRYHKWQVQIRINGKQRHIGYYENEEEAAADYARALFKFKGQDALDKARGQNSSVPAIDLSDVLPQQPIPKSKWYIKEGASKYTGVHFNKAENKWQANIYIGGKQRSIGYYENEEEAAVDYARALFKYKGQDAQDKARGQNSSVRAIDLRDVPPQQPILKSKRRMKEGVSKYVGVYPNQANNKWTAIITIDSKPRYIGSYKNEEEAAIDFARAVFKYRGQKVFEDIMEKCQTDGFEIDLADVPPQKPIPKSKGRMKEGASKYAGVSFDKSMKKWKAQITIEGKVRLISYYVNEEEAAVDYARAVFKYQGQGVLDKKRKLNSSRPGIVIDLTDVPPKLPILKSVGRTKEGSSKYAGVTFDKANNKWKTKITIEGKIRHLGCYENEEEAAIVYARAVFKYKGQEALNNLKERNSSAPSIDLSDVPPQLPILKRADQVKEGASKYAGVYFHKANSKWLARIELGGKIYYIGSYENEEEAAADHARAVFKYKIMNSLHTPLRCEGLRSAKYVSPNK